MALGDCFQECCLPAPHLTALLPFGNNQRHVHSLLTNSVRVAIAMETLIWTADLPFQVITDAWTEWLISSVLWTSHAGNVYENRYIGGEGGDKRLLWKIIFACDPLSFSFNYVVLFPPPPPFIVRFWIHYLLFPICRCRVTWYLVSTNLWIHTVHRIRLPPCSPLSSYLQSSRVRRSNTRHRCRHGRSAKLLHLVCSLRN